MAELDLISLGPWSGIDNVHDADAGVFQIAGENEARRPALVTALDVDLNDDGWPQRRGGVVEGTALTAGLSVFSGAGLLLAQDGGTIQLVDPDDWSTQPLVTDLTADALIHFHTHAGQVWWTNGITTGRILADGTALNWGCAVAPAPALGTTTGTLRADRYMVAATFVDAAGVEHGASEVSVVTLNGTQAITVNLSSVDSLAVAVKLYATKPNHDGLFFVKAVAPGALPTTITDVEVSEEPLRTQHLSPPLPADGLFSYNGQLVLFAENFLFPSYGVNAHLFEIADILEGRPTTVIAGAGLDDGFWTLCADSAYWTTGGPAPEDWVTRQRDTRLYAAGSLVLPGRFIPQLGVASNVAVFVSEDGLTFGLPDGTILAPQQGQIHIDVVGKRASIVFKKQDNLRQILFTLN